MNYSRPFYSSDVLINANVYVAGGEYGGGPAEPYNTLANTWTVIPPPSANFSEAASKLLPNGNVLQSDSQSGYVIYNAASKSMTSGGPSANSATVSATPLGPPPVPTGLAATGGADALAPFGIRAMGRPAIT